MAKDRRTRHRSDSTPSANPIALFVVLVVLFVPIIFGIGYVLKKIDPNRVDVAQPGPQAGEDPKSFDELLSQGAVGDLIDESNAYGLNRPDLDLPVRIDLLQRRLKIAERLREFPDNPLAHQYSVISAIDSMAMLNTLSEINNLGLDDIRPKLILLATTHAEDPDDLLARKANNALILSYTQDFLFEPDEKRLQKIVSTAENAVRRLPDDQETAFTLQRTGLMMKASKHNEAAEEMLTFIERHYGSSENPEVQKIVEASRFQTHFLNYDFVNLQQRVVAGDKSAVPEIAESVANITRDNQVFTGQGYATLFSAVEIVLSVSELDVAKQMAESIRKSLDTAPANQATTGAKEFIDKLFKRIDSFGSQVQFGGLADLNDNPLDPSELEGKAVGVVFWSATNQTSVDLVGKLDALSWVNSQGGRLLAVCVSERSEISGSLKRKFRNSESGVRVVRLADGDEGRAFESQFSIPDVPYLFIVDRAHHIVAIKVRPQSFGQKMAEILK